jgi:hypothetical protein
LGFESDWRDPDLGVNSVTLMEFTDPPDKRRLDLAKVVLYALERKMIHTPTEYQDYAICSNSQSWLTTNMSARPRHLVRYP